MIHMTSRTRCEGSFSAVLCDDEWGICLKNERLMWHLFSCCGTPHFLKGYHTFCTLRLKWVGKLVLFLEYESLFSRVQSDIVLGSDSSAWDCMARSSYIVHSTMVADIPRSVTYQVILFGDHILDRGMFFDCLEFRFTASEHVIALARFMSHGVSVRHWSSCWFGKFPQSKCSDLSVSVLRTWKSISCGFFLVLHVGFSFRSGQEVVSWPISRWVFFRLISFFTHFDISSVQSWLGVGSRVVSGNRWRCFAIFFSEGVVVFVFSCLNVVDLLTAGVYKSGRLWVRIRFFFGTLSFETV